MIVPDQLSLPFTLLYVPGDRPDRFAKAAAASGAVILDLEDAVHADRKPLARQAVAEYLKQPSRPAQTWVRVGRATLDDDLDAVRDAESIGIVLADAVPETLAVIAQERSDTPVIALVESARALESLSELAASPGLVTFGLGEVDLLADLRVRRAESTSAVIDGIRSRIVQVAAAAGLSAPIAPTSLSISDLDEVRRSTRHLRDLGFRRRTAIHPAQCAAIVSVFSPTFDEIRHASEIIGLLEQAGGAVAVDTEGRFVDAAVIRSARETLAAAEQGETR